MHPAPSSAIGRSRARRVRSWIVAVALAPLLVPAAASASAVWNVEDVGVSAQTALRDVAVLPVPDGAAGERVVVAVGDDSGAPVIRRLAAGDWVADEVPLPATLAAGTEVSLSALATAGGIALAVGHAGSAPLVLRAEVAELAQAGPVTWQAVTAAGPTAPVRAVSLVAVDGGASGFVADAAGVVRTVDLTATGTTFGPALELPPNGGPRGLAAFAAGEGIAVGPTSADPLAARFIRLTTQPPGRALPMVAVEGTTGAGYCTPDLVAVAAAGTTDVLAVDGGCLWALSSDGTWTRQPTGNQISGVPGIALSDVAVAGTGTDRVAAVAGRIGSGASAGTVWWRTGAAAWRPDTGLGAALRAVAVGGPEDIWAVGDAGTVRRYGPPPPPPEPDPEPDPEPEPEPEPDPDDDGDGGDGDGGNGGAGGEVELTPTSTSDGTTPDDGGDPADESAPAPALSVQQPPATPKRPAAKKKGKKRRRGKGTRLMTNVRVMKSTAGLVLSYRLTAPARIQILAKRRGRIVGRADAGARPAGPGRLLIRLRGVRASELKIVVRPVRKAGRGAREGVRR